MKINTDSVAAWILWTGLAVLVVAMTSSCVSNVQHIYVDDMPTPAGCKVLIIGAQIAAKPVDLGILNPTAAASQNGDVRQDVERNE